MFWAEIRKIRFTPVNPTYCINVGFKGVKIIKAGFRDVLKCLQVFIKGNRHFHGRQLCQNKKKKPTQTNKKKQKKKKKNTHKKNKKQKKHTHTHKKKNKQTNKQKTKQKQNINKKHNKKTTTTKQKKNTSICCSCGWWFNQELNWTTFWGFFFVRENKAWYFVWAIFLADTSHEMANIIFSDFFFFK